jgi:hypothetical protein
MVENVVVEPMTEEFILWRCLHSGPLSRDTIDKWPSSSTMSWERYRERNTPLLRKLTRTYGTSAIVARDGDQIVGKLRFYPRAVCDMEGAGGLCLQQDSPAGPADDFADNDFPAPAQIEDRTLAVHFDDGLWEDNHHKRLTERSAPLSGYSQTGLRAIAFA